MAAIGIFGEVLFDCFPDGSQVLGGAPFNVAWHLQAFKQQPLFISRLGQDAAAVAVREAMSAWGMTIAGLQQDSLYPTGRVAVRVQDGEPSYEILDQQAYDYIQAEQLPKLDVSILYHGSLAVRHPLSRSSLSQLKRQHHGKIFLDVNLREPWWQLETLMDLIAAADWLKLNQAEFQLLNAGIPCSPQQMQAFLQKQQLDVLLVTEGEQGASLYSAASGFLQIRPSTQYPVLDSVGAGDAFSAVMLTGLLQDWPLSLSLQRAQDFASALLSQRGATIRDPRFYLPFITAWGL